MAVLVSKQQIEESPFDRCESSFPVLPATLNTLGRWCSKLQRSFCADTGTSWSSLLNTHSMTCSPLCRNPTIHAKQYRVVQSHDHIEG